MPSVVTEAWLEELAREGLIPPREVVHWRAPSESGVVPHPNPGEVVTFRIFYTRGLWHPAHPFLLGLLEECTRRLSCSTSTPTECCTSPGS